MKQLENLPGIKWAMIHPRLAAWIVLSAGMVILLVIEARDVGLLATQWIALIVACVLVAGACIWIISWEDSDDDEDEPETATKNEAASSSESNPSTPVESSE